MRRLHPIHERLATNSVPVLIEGEVGTGKELLAECIHEASKRTGPWAAIDCGPNPNLERELFGEGETAGLIEMTSGGTLFFDEIADLPRALQGTLLRLLERGGGVRRIGDPMLRGTDVRILASTRRNLEREVQAGRFREDLLRVMSATHVTLPPLREREGDVRLLALHFAEMYGETPLPEAALASFEDAPWRGNVRELRNAVSRYVTLGDVSLPERSRAAWASSDLEDVDTDEPYPVARRKALAAFERRYIARLLDQNDGNVLRAAAHSGIGLRYFQQVKARHGLGRDSGISGRSRPPGADLSRH